MSFDELKKERPPKWSLGVLNDKLTDEVPGKMDQLEPFGAVRNAD